MESAGPFQTSSRSISGLNGATMPETELTGVFRDRRDTGHRLGDRLAAKYSGADAIVLGLPRGGVPVADEVARRLGAPLDVIVVRKLGAPFNPEFAIGAIASGGIVYLSPYGLDQAGLDEADVEPLVARERAELARREELYRRGRGPLEIEDKTVFLVDDGIATGSTMEAAVLAVRTASPRRVIVASPTASRSAVALLERAADAVEVLKVPEPYFAVGLWYASFPQLSDDEVVDILARHHGAAGTDGSKS